MDEYVPWSDDGCVLGSAVERLAAGNALNIESAKANCRQLLLSGSLVAYGRAGLGADAPQLIKRAAWSGLTIDWRLTKVYVRTAGAWRVVAYHASETGP